MRNIIYHKYEYYSIILNTDKSVPDVILAPVMPCERPPQIAHANYPNKTAKVGDTAYYYCHRDHWFVIDKETHTYDVTLKCEEDGKWYPKIGNCTSMYKLMDALMHNIFHD